MLRVRGQWLNVAELESRCVEYLQEIGHLSYACPKNSMGTRKAPVKKRKKIKQKSSTALPNDSSVPWGERSFISSISSRDSNESDDHLAAVTTTLQVNDFFKDSVGSMSFPLHGDYSSNED